MATPIQQPKVVRDGILSALGGVDSSKIPSIINANQLAWAINATVRGGAIDQRPAFIERTLTFADDEQEDWITTHRLTGGGTYRDAQGLRHLVAIVSGRVFLVDPANEYTVTEITPNTQTLISGAFVPPAIAGSGSLVVTNSDYVWEDYPLMIGGYKYLVTAKSGTTLTVTNINDPTAAYADATPVLACDPNNPNKTQGWCEQAEQWLVVQDGQGAAILYNGTSSRRATDADAKKPEVPCGTSMVYCRGRLWVVVGMYEVAAGDLVGGATDVINFYDEKFIAEGGRFRCDQPIKGLKTTATIDTSMGQGPVLVLTRDEIYSINVPADRTKWKSQSYPIITTAQNQGGCEAFYSMVQVNTDLFYRAPDGWRSFYMARKDTASSWVNVPISQEMDRILKSDSENLLPYASAMFWKNYLLCTVAPGASTVGVYHKAVAVIDFAPISSMSGKENPIWTGLWTGILPILMFAHEFSSEQRGFIWATSTAAVLKLYEIRTDAFLDNETTRIESVIESRSMSFGDPIRLKRLTRMELWVANVKGTVGFELYWRPDQAECWYTWSTTKEICATYQDCDQDETSCKTIANYRPGYRSRQGFGPCPTTDCEPQDLKPANLGYEFQIRLKWIGKCALRKMLFKAETMDELPEALCD